MAHLYVKNWDRFQHYKKRTPPWIKLHRALLDDFDFMRLPLASIGLAELLWLLASETTDGSVPYNIPWLAFRLRRSEQEVCEGLEPLIKKGFFIPDSDALAQRKHAASQAPGSPPASRPDHQRESLDNDCGNNDLSSDASSVLAHCEQDAPHVFQTPHEGGGKQGEGDSHTLADRGQSNSSHSSKLGADSSTVLAPCYQDACLEGEAEGEAEGETETYAPSDKSHDADDDDTECDNASSDDDPVFVWILMQSGDEYPVRESKVAEYVETYPDIDVRHEFVQCRQWNRDHPRERKTRRGMTRHFNFWMSMANEKAKQPTSPFGKPFGNGGYSRNGAAAEQAKRDLRNGKGFSL